MLTCALLVDACSNHDPEEKDFSDVITESFRSVTKEEKLEQIRTNFITSSAELKERSPLVYAIDKYNDRLKL